MERKKVRYGTVGLIFSLPAALIINHEQVTFATGQNELTSGDVVTTSMYQANQHPVLSPLHTV